VFPTRPSIFEIGVLRGILKRAKRWHLFADEFKPLPVHHDVGRALSPEEKDYLIKISARRDDWQSARLAMTLALNTTMRGCELKGLRWRDVDLSARTITIRRSKTKAGIRVIPLNSDAWEAIQQLRRRSESIGGTHPEHYVFFACENGVFDPAKQQKSWRSAWRSLTRAIECPACGTLQSPAKSCRNGGCKADIRNVKNTLHGLRFHDLRHHAITELAESEASEQTIMSIAGHVSREMLEHYSHVRLQAKRRALDAIVHRPAEGSKTEGADGSYITNDVTVEAFGQTFDGVTVGKKWSARWNDFEPNWAAKQAA